ncbi:NAD(P)-dependent dehydrogenase (short-subunit alcohol dehydrogenase family) [Actinoplanes lutulentus]|uniref:NADP-dependent 3-hydroxy acid dehydrogenase YdfG n=1 Tax=Actinoplanes lutulentus TaxID=1287878 RepID=A0A327ZLI2_9ACTN|nr:SDR family NAD(P)-dependent oxidoreductase [Actinoplanes lutulentus]MBB2948052.1 NAD(P)-dependent dehydrogenase (short-subunit alcohol dehydrogenase family) [Actinoplanes lutulentus]RAK40067.1 NADP-dependent 3-hydroxy acid dehydrogenase YdfG [Actinoplanes lutulentus]
MTDTRTALVTGGTGGLGSATISAFLAAGWRVVAPARPGTAARLPAGAIPVDADLTDAAQVRAAAEAAASDQRAPLKAVVNLAGGYAGSGLIADTPVEEFEAMFAANLRPTYLTTAAALPHLVAAGGGSVICVSSRAAVSPFPGAAGYVTSKAAVLAFAETVAVEYKKQHVRCNTVLPSIIDTPANRAAQPDADVSRWVSPEEIAAVILFLASDASAPTSGARIPVYGAA